MHTEPVLVIGSTGKTGRRIVRKLQDRSVPVRHGSRRSAIPFDWEKPAGWAEALRGVRAMYIAYFPDLAYPGAANRIAALTEVAASAGVQHLVLLSGRGEQHAQRCEQIVRQSGLGYTLIRAAWFAQNFNEGYLREPAMHGVIELPAGLVREPIVDAEDIADVAVAALTDPRHVGEEYDVTGPRLLGFADAAAELSRAMGRQVRYEPITLTQFHVSMRTIGGDMIADVLTGICREVLDGRNATLGDGVQRALGRQPRDFGDFCAAAAQRGDWEAAA